jgi:hypothetical protein
MSQILTFENPLGSPYSPMNDLPGARAPEEARAPRSGAAARCPRVGQAHRRRAVCAGGRLHLVRPASRMGQSKAQPKPKRAAQRKKTGRSGSAVTLLRQTVSVFAAFLALSLLYPSFSPQRRARWRAFRDTIVRVASHHAVAHRPHPSGAEPRRSIAAA